MKKSQTKQVVASCFLANTLEIYDFVIFGFLSKSLHENYLSFLSKETALLVTYIFFAIGFLFRPIGSLIFGYIGDTLGRKKALVMSVSLMGICSLTMCLLPTYEAIGIASCYIIVLVRVIQGISVGGEFTGAIVFTMEHTEKRYRGLSIGILAAGGACGVMLASLASKILQNESLPDYSWRLAFLFGFCLAIVGFFIRKRLEDTKEFSKIKRSKGIPLLEGFKTQKLESLSTMLVAAANGTSFFFGSVFLSSHLSSIRADQDYKYVSLLVSFIMFFSLPFSGYISDRFNRKNYLIFTSAVMAITGFFFVNLISFASGDVAISIFSILYTLAASAMIGGINIYSAEIFEAKTRMSCMSFFYSIGMGCIGGTVPMVANYITGRYSHPEYILGGYISVICLSAALSVHLVKLKKLTKSS